MSTTEGSVRPSLVGEPHSTQRYIVFGVLAGVASAVSSLISGAYLPYVAIPAIAISGYFAGLRSNRES